MSPEPFRSEYTHFFFFFNSLSSKSVVKSSQYLLFGVPSSTDYRQTDFLRRHPHPSQKTPDPSRTFRRTSSLVSTAVVVVNQTQDYPSTSRLPIQPSFFSRRDHPQLRFSLPLNGRNFHPSPFTPIRPLKSCLRFSEITLSLTQPHTN